MTLNSHVLRKLIKKSATGIVSFILIGFNCGFSTKCAAISASPDGSSNSSTVMSAPSDNDPSLFTTKTAPLANVTPSNNSSNGATATTVPMPSMPTNNSAKTSVPLNQPNMKNDDILNFAKNVSKAVYSYDFKNYKNQIPLNQPYFTNAGWKAFNDALNKSNNLKTVETKKLVASATILGNPTLLEQGVKNGRYTWKVHVPVLATYENEARLIKQNLSITLLISRTNTGQGIGVSHFIAEMVPPNTQTQNTQPNSLSPVSTTTNKSTNQPDVPAPMTKTPGQTTPGTPTPPNNINLQNTNPMTNPPDSTTSPSND